MIVVDTSAWVEFLRQTGTPADLTLTRLVAERADLVVTEVVVMEVLMGARSTQHLRALRRQLLSFPILPLRGMPSYETAAALYRACRRAGETIRKITDCLVAVPAIEAGATLIQADRDFEILARHTPLRLEPLAA